jgi:hypothetical protein
MQCCGEPFAVGDEVEWFLNDDPDRDWLEAALGMEVAQRISHAQEHHGALPDDAPATRGKVLAIKTAHGRYEALPNDGGVLYPVASTAALRDIDRADGRESDRPDARLNGFIVELELGSRAN